MTFTENYECGSGQMVVVALLEIVWNAKRHNELYGSVAELSKRWSSEVNEMRLPNLKPLQFDYVGND